MRRKLKEQYAELEAFSNRQYKINVQRAFVIVSNFVYVLCAAYVYSALDHYQYIQQDRIVDNGFLALSETVYPLDQVKDITFSQYVHNFAGEKIYRRNGVYVITFATGQKWTSDDLMSHSSEGEREKEVLEYISQQTSIPIREIPEYAYGDF
jgi:hypothetical protein